MLLPIILLGVAGLIGLGILIIGARDVTRAHNWAEILQALFTIFALTLAGYWYFVERRGEPHADVSQTVHVMPLSDDLIAIEVHATIKNLGQRLLKVRSVRSKLQRVELGTYGYDELAGLQGDDYWRASRPGTSDDAQFHQAELRWPIHEQFNDTVDNSVEPGESDIVVVTYLFRCSQDRHLRVATDVVRPSDDGGKEVAWKARSFVDTSPFCGTEAKGKGKGRTS